MAVTARASRPARSARPVHRNPGLLALVFVGGALGTFARAAIGLAWPAEATHLPVSTLVINLSGAFLLGVLQETLAHLGPDRGARRAVRLCAGNGFFGGFTTYSTLAVETATRISGGVPILGLVYMAVTIVGGALAAWVAIGLVRVTCRARKGGRR